MSNYVVRLYYCCQKQLNSLTNNLRSDCNSNPHITRESPRSVRGLSISLPSWTLILVASVIIYRLTQFLARVPSIALYPSNYLNFYLNHQLIYIIIYFIYQNRLLFLSLPFNCLIRCYCVCVFVFVWVHFKLATVVTTESILLVFSNQINQVAYQFPWTSVHSWLSYIN